MPGLDIQRVAILGATGSVGTQTLAVIDHLNAQGHGRWEIHSLAAGTSTAELAELCLKYKPKLAGCCAEAEPELAKELAGSAIELRPLTELAEDPEVDLVVLAIYGLAALPPLLAAIRAGKRVLLASKEALVAGGRFVMDEVREHGATLLPLDSEHSALFQCLDGRLSEDVRRIVLTASGGPFRGYSREQLADVSYEQALRHPVWNMGAAITLNSATLFNKGLELIEAHHLFGIPPEHIAVLVHPEGTVHGMVEFTDGNQLWCASAPDMRQPIQYALTWPQRRPGQAVPLDLSGGLTFDPPDLEAFPALQACREALDGPWWLPAALLAANEELCGAFRTGRLPFLAIGDGLVELARAPSLLSLDTAPEELKALDEVERSARRWVTNRVAQAGRQAC